MDDQYHIDVAKYRLSTFKNTLRSRVLIPSRMRLKDGLDERFRRLELMGITTMKDLLDALKTKPKIARISQETGVSVDYLTLLKREANSYLPTPTRLDKFPGILPTYVEKLATIGITHSRHLFREAKEKQQRARLADRTDIPLDILNELICLSDLSRLYGVGPVFARMLYDVGITSIEALRAYTAEEVIRIYEEKTQKKADFGVNEIQFSLDLAQTLDIAVEL
jgi:predicted RecB family nuclease